MTSRLWRAALAVVLGLTVSAGVATAQGQGRAVNDVEDTAAEEVTQDDGLANVPEARLAETADSMVAEMRGILTKALDRLREARESKDAVQLTCVNEEVAAMKGILRVSEDARVAIGEALQSGQPETARYEFQKVRVSRRKMDDLYRQALNCAGAESSVSSTSVQVDIDEELLAVDPYYGDPDFFVDPADFLVGGSTDGLGEPDGPEVRPPVASLVL